MTTAWQHISLDIFLFKKSVYYKESDKNFTKYMGTPIQTLF